VSIPCVICFAIAEDVIDVALDMEGYKSGYHNRAKADKSSKEHFTLPPKETSQEQSFQDALTQGSVPEVEYHNGEHIFFPNHL
jgi:hypothetical protein